MQKRTFRFPRQNLPGEVMNETNGKPPIIPKQVNIGCHEDDHNDITLDVDFLKALLFCVIFNVSFLLCTLGGERKSVHFATFFIFGCLVTTPIFTLVACLVFRCRISKEGVESGLLILCSRVLLWEDISAVSTNIFCGPFYIIYGRKFPIYCVIFRPVFFKNPEYFKQAIAKFAPGNNILRKIFDRD